MDKGSNDCNINKPRSGKKALVESMKIGVDGHSNKVKFEIFGEEVMEKVVKLSGNSGRVFLPSTWMRHKVKIVRID